MSFIESVLENTIVGDTLTAGKEEKEAARVQQQGMRSAIDEQRSAREAFEERTQPFVDVGLTAVNPLMEFLSQQSGPQPQTIEEINPVVEFLRREGFEDIQESAAAAGKLRSGGTLQDLTRFNTQLAATVAPQIQQQKLNAQQQRFNQLFNILGIGQSSAVGQGQAALQSGRGIAGLQAGIGTAGAQGILGAEGARDQARSDIAGFLGGYQGGAFSPPPQQFGGL